MALGPSHRPILRGYGPLACLLLAFVLMAAFVPTNARERVTLTQGNGAAAPGVNGAGPAAGGATAPGAVSGGTTTTGAQLAKPGQLPANTSKCNGKQVPGDPYSPPCIAFSGNNGGATTRGVDATRHQRRLPGAQRARASSRRWPQLGRRPAPGHARRRRSAPSTALADYFNKHFQFYGRKIKIDFYNGKGSTTNELLGGGQREAEADAVHGGRARSRRSPTSAPRTRALRRRAAAPEGRRASASRTCRGEWHDAARALRLEPRHRLHASCTRVGAEYAVKQLAGQAGQVRRRRPQGQAAQARDPRAREPLVPGVRRRRAVNIAKAAGFAQPGPHRLPARPRHDVEPGGEHHRQAQEPRASPRSSAAATRSSRCSSSGKAEEQSYYPEWIVIGAALTDPDIVGQLYDQDQWQPRLRHQLARHDRMPLTADASATPPTRRCASDEPAFSVDLIYYQMYMLAIGIQMAGPNLTPETFEQGMFAYPRRLGPGGHWGFGPGDYTPTHDVREIYWDPNGDSTVQRQAGRLHRVRPGKRYRPGSCPRGDPNVRRAVTARPDDAGWSSCPRRWPRRGALPRLGVVVVLLVGCVRAPRTGAPRHRAHGVVYGTVTGLLGHGPDPHLPHQPLRQLRLRRHGRRGGVLGDRALPRARRWPYFVALPRRPWPSASLVGGARRAARHPPVRQLVAARPDGRHHRPGPGARRPRAARAEVLSAVRRSSAAFRTPLTSMQHRHRRRCIFTGDEMLIVRRGAGRARRRWPGSCCAPTPAWRCAAAAENTRPGAAARHPGPPARRRSCGSIAGGLAALTFVLKAPFTGVSPRRRRRPDAAAARAGGGRRRRHGVAADRVRRRRRPRHARAGRALEHDAGRR